MDLRDTAGLEDVSNPAGAVEEREPMDVSDGAGQAGGGHAAGDDGHARITFEQLVRGLGWLLRGTSERRALLCLRCFEENGQARGGGERNR